WASCAGSRSPARIARMIFWPVRQTMQIAGEAGELPHRLVTQIRRHRHEMAACADVDAGHIEGDPLQARALPLLAPLLLRLAFGLLPGLPLRLLRCCRHAPLLPVEQIPEAGLRTIVHSLEQGRRGATNDQVTPAPDQTQERARSHQ